MGVILVIMKYIEVGWFLTLVFVSINLLYKIPSVWITTNGTSDPFPISRLTPCTFCLAAFKTGSYLLLLYIHSCLLL
jgi:hypothetical protein